MARPLKTVKSAWKPQLGDRFTSPDRNLDDESSVLSNMTIPLHDRPEGLIIGFDAGSERALDDVDPAEARRLRLHLPDGTG